MPLVAPLSAAAVSAVLVVLAARPWGLGVLGWVALAPLFAHLPACRSWRTVAGGAGVVALAVSSVAYEPAAALGPGWHIFALTAGSLPFVVAITAGWAVARWLPRRLSHVVFALFWAAAEFLIAQPSLLGAYALPLASFGYTQAGLPAMHLARFSSVTATSVVVLLGNAAVAQVGTELAGWSVRAAGARRHGSLPAGRARSGASLFLTVLAGLGGLSWLAQLSAPHPGPGSFDVAVVQPNTPTAVLAAAASVPALAAAHVDHLARLATGQSNGSERVIAAGRSAGTERVAPASHAAPVSGPNWPIPTAGAHPDLIVFPEGALPKALSTAAPLSSVPASWLPTLNSLPPALIGAAGTAPDGASTNSAFLWAGGSMSHVYAKAHLVPVGEAGLVAGPRAPTPVLVRSSNGDSVAVAPLICYDIAFTATARAAATAGAQLIAVLTDDAFAARGDVPHLHLRLARFRAVESGLPVVFASNTGPSALIAGNGQLVAVSAADHSLLLRARLGEGVGPTPYIRYGNWVGALVCMAVASLATAGAASAAGKRGGGAPRQPAST